MVEDSFAARDGVLKQPKLLFSSNGSLISRFHTDKVFQTLVNNADIVDADGMPLVIASRIFCSRPLAQRIATTDFIHDASAVAQKHGLRFYFLGAHPGIAQMAADTLRRDHPELQIVGIRDGYFSHSEERSLCAAIRDAGTDILWLGLGSPIQEQFAARNREQLASVAWIKTCGGMFDHLAGRTRRAPMWMQMAGLEWISRMVQEPRRLTLRYLLSNPVAMYHLATKTFDLPRF